MSIHANTRTIDIGDKATFNKTFSPQDVAVFADLSGDHNPIHLDEEFAAKTRFGHRITHGMLTASLISTVLGNQLPGPGSIYLSQTLQFRAPVYIGDTVTATVEVLAVREDKRIVTLKTTCTNQASEVVIEGEAVLLVPE
jgi:3-hydroxybutyryl-CoA dehydratase